METRELADTSIPASTIAGEAAALGAPGEPEGAPSAVPSVSVVVPAMNEADNIGWVLQSIPLWVQEVILVDGDSTDATIDVAREQWPELTVLNQQGKGKGAALRQGFASASCDFVVMIDADGSMDPGEIDRYVAPLFEDECDLVKGSRWMCGGGSEDITPLRKLGNKMLLGLVNRTCKTEFTELCYGYMAIRRSCFERMQLTADGFEIETQMVVHAVKAGLRVGEVASMEAPRRCGTSNLHPVRDGVRILSTVASGLRHGPCPPQAPALPSMGARPKATIGQVDPLEMGR
ncbi:MAG: glycosyltransferase family 2 protein [Actinobacteria bacterium]|nr:glycosyltransferase family 2 protein [Actinomycetota bacterium]